MVENDEILLNNYEKCPPATVNVTVTVPSDCLGAQYCDWIICVYDVTGCYEDVQPVECKDYTYGTTTYYFNGLNISSSYVRVCILHKPGSPACGYTTYAPKCDCKATQSSLSFTLDLCVP